jgi:23S rRNA pseudouridine1911/1915/1917 synthase
MNIPIIYEDDFLFAINKPAGLTVHKTHPDDPHKTVADILLAERPYLASVGDTAKGLHSPQNLRPGIVHRLDKGTSGVMVIAKDQETFHILKHQFQARTVKKEYLALVHGRPRERSGVIDLPLGKVGTRQTVQLKGRRELTVRQARTEYAVKRTYADYSLLRVHPLTGRTHQIRVHLKAIGHPIAGDPEYGSGSSPAGLDRMFLHAQRLEITSPQGSRLALEAALPEPLQKVIDSLQ